MGAPKDEKTDIAMVVWLIRGGGRNVLFDTGYHRESWLKEFPSADYLRPDEAVRLAGVAPEDVTDIVISHAHWDHMGGIDLFPKATVWIQKQEYAYYTGDAWQPGGRHGGIDPEDVKALVQLNTDGRLRLVDGDDVEILPGIRAYTGARHTFASQYIRVAGDPAFVLASDNCYLYRNLAEHKASATFTEADQPGQRREPGAHDRARRLPRPRRPRTRPPAVREVPDAGPDRADPVGARPRDRRESLRRVHPWPRGESAFGRDDEIHPRRQPDVRGARLRSPGRLPSPGARVRRYGEREPRSEGASLHGARCRERETR